jgi:hypothetical protein
MGESSWTYFQEPFRNMHLVAEVKKEHRRIQSICRVEFHCRNTNTRAVVFVGPKENFNVICFRKRETVPRCVFLRLHVILRLP